MGWNYKPHNKKRGREERGERDIEKKEMKRMCKKGKVRKRRNEVKELEVPSP